MRYWHTLRHLRPVQIYGRAWFRFYRPVPDLAPAPKARPVSGGWCRPARRAPSLIGPGVFSLLGRTASLDDVGWDGSQCDKLWRYNQHYFDDLNAYDSQTRTDWHRVLLARWVDNNPPGKGVGWEPYPTSLRIVNWIKWALDGEQLPSKCQNSLAVQVRWLSRRLEIHLLGNHLFANAKALMFAGLFFEGKEADQWFKKGLRILEREVSEQILPDGGHFERSTMYHALALEDLLDLINIFDCYRDALDVRQNTLLSWWRDRASRMLDWLLLMCHPDGEIGLFNDAAFGVAPSCKEL
ncbi:MAG: heparinase, partial [Gammaproteobacteria bacterium]